MSKSNKEFNFSTLLATSVHDIKNVLGSTLESLDWITNSGDELTREQSLELEQVSQLIALVNSQLMELLCLYKFEEEQYKLNIREGEIEDFLEMQRAFILPLVKQKQINIEIDCDEDLTWKYDEMLLSAAVRNALLNAIKFAKTKILLSAVETDGSLKIVISDDGAGFPDKLLGFVKDRIGEVDLNTGGTGLGLYFSEIVVEMHSKDNKQGHLELRNGEYLSGANYILTIS